MARFRYQSWKEASSCYGVDYARLRALESRVYVGTVRGCGVRVRCNWPAGLGNDIPIHSRLANLATNKVDK